MRLRAYLVDDEPLAVARLTRLLGDTGRVEVIGSTSDPEEAVEALTAMHPDPVPRSRTVGSLSGLSKRRASRTRVSVSGRGTSTAGDTSNFSR